MEKQTYLALRETYKKLNQIFELENTNYSKEYRVFDLKKNNNPFSIKEMEVLSCFNNITLKDFYKERKSKNVGWDNSPLFDQKGDLMLFSHDIATFLYFYLVSQLKDEINRFLKFFEINKMSLEVFQDSVISQNFFIVSNLFTEVKRFINQDKNEQIIIDTDKIRFINEEINPQDKLETKDLEAKYDFSVLAHFLSTNLQK